MVYRHKISHWPAETRANRLLGSASQDMLNRATDQLPKRMMMVIKVKGAGAHVEFRLDGYLYSAQCKRRNANGATQMAG